ncbi:MAG: hypothetical protein KDC34_18605 [Saprospiraceae bacterium]|nr:hypothetical protein [Saprospiraceae bacterium]
MPLLFEHKIKASRRVYSFFHQNEFLFLFPLIALIYVLQASLAIFLKLPIAIMLLYSSYSIYRNTPFDYEVV